MQLSFGTLELAVCQSFQKETLFINLNTMDQSNDSDDLYIFH